MQRDAAGVLRKGLVTAGERLRAEAEAKVKAEAERKIETARRKLINGYQASITRYE